MGFLVNLGIEKSFFQIQAKGDGSHDEDMKLMTSLGSQKKCGTAGTRSRGANACLIEVQHGLFEQRCIGFDRPSIFPDGIPVSAYLHRFFIIGSLCTKRRNFHWVRRLGHLFAPDLDVASIGTRIFPCKQILWTISQSWLKIRRKQVYLGIRG